MINVNINFEKYTLLADYAPASSISTCSFPSSQKVTPKIKGYLNHNSNLHIHKTLNKVLV